MKRMLRFAITAAHLQPGQIINRFKRKLLPPQMRSLAEAGFNPVTGQWTAPVNKAESIVPSGRFSFLNNSAELEFPSGWNDSAFEKLWLYNLHYFDWLGAPGFADAGSGDSIAVKWAIENPVGTGNGWEPYPLSLRLVNWAKAYFSGTLTVDTTWESFCRQSDWLCQSVEWHILANHLFANAKALVFAGAAINGPLGQRILNQGIRILGRQLDEQILPDGGHYERSPMYHSIIFEDVLDLLNLVFAYPDKFEPAFIEMLQDCATRMLHWLQVMTHPDGQISFFNDSAFGTAARPSQLFDYAERLGFRQPVPITESVDLPESGYTRLQQGAFTVFVNTAPIEPAYQPGHAHADTLSIEVSFGKERVIVNGGTSSYQNLERRAVERSTARHSTVEIDGRNSSDIWARFRVAQRARITSRNVDIGGKKSSVSAQCIYASRIIAPPKHQRQISVNKNGIEIVDQVGGRLRHWSSRLQFAPNISLRQQDARLLSIICLDDRELKIRFSDPVFLEAGHWAAEFGLLLPNTTARTSPSSNEAFIKIEAG